MKLAGRLAVSLGFVAGAIAGVHVGRMNEAPSPSSAVVEASTPSDETKARSPDKHRAEEESPQSGD